MHMLINAVVLAITLPADPAEIARAVPSCTAELDGRVLHTQVEFIDGFVIEGPWRIMHASTGALKNGDRGRIIAAVLDRIVEKDALTGKRRMLPFARGVVVTFEGATPEDLLASAAELWCATVMRLGRGSNGFAPAATEPLRITRAASPTGSRSV
jgi:hypothetical protein